MVREEKNSCFHFENVSVLPHRSCLWKPEAAFLGVIHTDTDPRNRYLTSWTTQFTSSPYFLFSHFLLFVYFIFLFGFWSLC